MAVTGKGRVLFVDDEKRVLNSMRGLFRREYELYLTTNGAEAISIAAEHDIDVIVADQRMPGMTGVEVLGKIRQLSPRTVRILLTGYADPEAIEGSINVGEVFRFLSKPCQPALLRDTLKLAISAARATPATALPRAQTPAHTLPARGPMHAQPEFAAPPVVDTRTSDTEDTAEVEVLFHPDSPEVASPTPAAPADQAPAVTPAPAEPAAPGHWDNRTEIVMSGDTSREIRQLRMTQEADNGTNKVGVAVFTINPTFAETVMRTISTDRIATLATTLVKVAEVLEQRQAGVLVTDFTSNIVLLQNMIGALKHHLPELVTIVVSENRDATDMINLINYGQVFRYVEKPVDSQALRTDVNAAVLKHLQLLEHPELVERHQVFNMTAPNDASATFNQFIGKVTRLRGRWTNTNGKSH